MIEIINCHQKSELEVPETPYKNTALKECGFEVSFLSSLFCFPFYCCGPDAFIGEKQVSMLLAGSSPLILYVIPLPMMTFLLFFKFSKRWRGLKVLILKCTIYA